MTRSLLKNRFNMVAQVESRQMQVEALVLARPNGSLGPRLLPMSGECSTHVLGDLRQRFSGTAVSGCSRPGITDLVMYLTFRFNEPFVDGTSLTGTVYYLLSARMPPLLPGLGKPLNDPSDLPALSTALEEQLGLKLQSRKGPLPVVVIESIQRPSDN